MIIKIRYNTDREKKDLTLSPWRVLVDGEEKSALWVIIEVPSWTTYDEVSPGIFKWHITCKGKAVWDGYNEECVILPE